MGKSSRKFNPARRLILIFLAFISAGTLALMLPGMTTGPISIVDALFTATSAVCVTGLTVLETGEFFTFPGQIVILVLIQLGGLGYMSMASLIVILTGRINIGGKLMLRQQIFKYDRVSLRSFVYRVAAMTFGFQLAGAAFLAWRMRDMFDSFTTSAYFGLFHSVSAFNNAGFDIFGAGADGSSLSLTPLRNDVYSVLFISLLIIGGGIGYVVVSDLWDKFKYAIKGKKRYLNIHTKIVLSATAILLTAGTAFFFFAESGNAGTLQGMAGGQRLLMAFFQSVTPRTAGFNMTDTSALINVSIIFTIIIMFIGASPGGTGGGIKTTTFAAVCAYVKSAFKKNRDVNIFKKRLTEETITKAMIIFVLSIGVIAVSALMVLAAEPFTVGEVLFEVTSAFSTVGLSKGITDSLSSFSKVVLTVTMLTGRLGPITAVGALLSASRHRKYRYPEEEIAVG